MKCENCNDRGYVSVITSDGEREMEACPCAVHREMTMTEEEFLALHGIGEEE